jgi:hypothetical protein
LNDLIQADGNFTNDQALIERMRPAMEGLFADAYDPSGATAGVFESFVPWDGAWLAQQLVKDSLSTDNPVSVREQVFQATLLEVVTEVFNAKQFTVSQQEQGALTTAVMELAKTYAWLNPNPEATVPAEGEAFGFLDLLWRLQVPDANGQFKGSWEIATALQKGVSELGQLLDGVQEPVRAIQFINNLMQAAAKVPTLKNDLKDARFLRELMEFGFEFVKSNPTVNQSGTDTAVQGFLDRLWRGDAQQVKQAQSGLSAFFKGMDTEAEKIKGLDFAVNLLDAAELLQGEGLQTQKHDPVSLDALIELGGVYAALKPVSSYSVTGAMDQIEVPDSFLNIVWQAQSEQDLQNGAAKMGGFFTKEILEYERQTLKEMMKIPALEDQLRNPDFFNSIFLSSSYYVTLEETDDLLALIDATETAINNDDTSIANKSLNSSSDAAVQSLKTSADGKFPGREEDYWKNGAFPIPQAYSDFYFFFILPLNLEWKQSGPVSYTDLPDGTRVNARPFSGLDTRRAPTVEAIRRPTGADPRYLKMRYIPLGEQLP